MLNLVTTPNGENGSQVYNIKAGQFGRRWAKLNKKDKNAFPSFDEVMDGVQKWYIAQMEGVMKDSMTIQ